MSDIISKMTMRSAAWLTGEGKYSEIVISSRARLARNLQNILFTEKASETQQEEVINRVREAYNSTRLMNDAHFYDVLKMDKLDLRFLAERRLISEDFAEGENRRGLLFSDDEKTSIMINEEDHIRMQVIFPGFSLDQAWYTICQINQEVSEHLDYAFSERFGYLTACPTNVGTGVRFSVFIHLPVLIFTKEIDKMFSEMIPAGIAVRGFYGEGSKVAGNLFQISNQYTLGWTEQGILDRVVPLIEVFIDREYKARERLMQDQHIVIEDKVFRAIGILTKAKILPSMEFLDLLSALRLGVDMNIIKGIDRKLFNELMVMTQPAHIQKMEGKILNEIERDVVRADIVRKKLKLK